MKKDVLKMMGIYAAVNVLSIPFFMYGLGALLFTLIFYDFWVSLIGVIVVFSIPNGIAYQVMRNRKTDFVRRNQKLSMWCALGSIGVSFAVALLVGT